MWETLLSYFCVLLVWRKTVIAYNDISDNSVLPASCQQFVSPFPVSTCQSPPAPTSSTKRWFPQFGVEEAWRAPTSLSHPTLRWAGGLSQTWSPASVLDLADAPVSEWEENSAASWTRLKLEEHGAGVTCGGIVWPHSLFYALAEGFRSKRHTNKVLLKWIFMHHFQSSHSLKCSHGTIWGVWGTSGGRLGDTDQTLTGPEVRQEEV